MKYTLIGFSTYNFKGADGNEISGVQLHFFYQNQNVEGRACKIFNCNNPLILPPDLKSCIGKEFMISYRDRGPGKTASIVGMLAV